MSQDQQIDLFNLQGVTQAPAPEVKINRDLIPVSASTPIPVGTYASLADMAVHCNQCQRCDLAATRTNVVISRGNPQAPIMIIGEGPGQTEDETGLPFVGRAGQLLEKILAAVHLEAERDVYICNIVKCRPPGNRTPTPDESAACRPYVLEQIRLVSPKIILLTGATAVRGITGIKKGITKIRGEWLTWEGYLCMPILHPAYLLRNPSKAVGSPKWQMWQDIQQVRQKLEELQAAEGS
ncbi:uracil-DNA glycosylase [Lyngbya confervoides]|uniref:Type-4 uracil-DNA glycosylase n=1 Tax=Lyngbya confervoides BDU141951 TaxID=1574623 RepID=A0ABD4T2I0_9CYAN|nr:uracil-DNA glycosylase [Lyngbya confervoides]MCM1982650.1 uracil-DNA glycosylase [Lyngbya confervoides BDU141951]